MKDEITSFRTTAHLRAQLDALKRARVGKNQTERVGLGIACLCEKHGIKVEA